MAKKMKLDKALYLRWYENMLLYRRFEEKCGQLYTMQKFGGFCHLYIGQEAVLEGFETAITKDDKVITAYRDHVNPIARGIHAKYVMAELYGKSTGISKGMGGSMHMFSKEYNLFGGHGIVGGQIPLGAGIAFADKYKGNNHVTICYMGDGAVRQGAFHEALNMAMLWKLPVIFVIENNNYVMGTSVARTSNVTELHKLGLSYEMPSVSVDGMRVDEVYEVAQKAVQRARKGDGPTLVEARTYRFKGHSMSDPQNYRTKEEVEEFKNQDPIDWVLSVIYKNKWAKEDEIKSINEKIKAMVDESVAFAEESPFPEPEALFEYVYEQKDYPFIKD
jgi:pyruvate dehydrogenase E1 component alpha subunit